MTTEYQFFNLKLYNFKKFIFHVYFLSQKLEDGDSLFLPSISF